MGLKILRFESAAKILRVRAFLNYINSLVEERAFIGAMSKKSLAEEKKWMKQVLKSIKKDEMMAFVAMEKRKLAGIVWAKRSELERERDNWEISIGVIKEQRGKGVGKTLLLKIIEEVKRRSPNKIFIDVFKQNKIAFALYKKVGFAEFARIEKCGKDNRGKYMLDKILMVYKGKNQ